MRFRLLLADRGHLVIANKFWFKGRSKVATLNLEENFLDINVKHDGKCGMAWALDADGFFYKFTNETILPANIFQRFGLSPKVARYHITSPINITAGELIPHVEPLQDPFEEAPNPTDLKKFLKCLSANQKIGRAEMKQYLGE